LLDGPESFTGFGLRVSRAREWFCPRPYWGAAADRGDTTFALASDRYALVARGLPSVAVSLAAQIVSAIGTLRIRRA